MSGLKMTLLEMVQNILSSMDSDDVNSISDTVEAGQVALICKNTYNDLVAITELPEHHRLGRLDAVSDPTKPNYLKIPDNVKEVTEFRYQTPIDTVPNEVQWKDVLYMAPFDFLRLVQGRRNVDANTYTVVDYNNVPMYIDQRTPPTFWTTFDDQYIICDSYDADDDTTLQSSKTTALFTIFPEWIMDDDFIPSIDAHLFPRLLAEAKATAHIELKQSQNPAAERTARQQKVSQHNKLHRVKQNDQDSYPDYGRRRTSGRVRFN